MSAPHTIDYNIRPVSYTHLDVYKRQIIAIEFKIQGTLGKHMLFVVNQVVGGNAEHPGGEAAFLFKRGKMGHHL